MSMSSSLYRAVPRAFPIALTIALASAATATAPATGAVGPYALVGSFTLPSGDVAIDLAPDGRLITVDGVGTIQRQSAINTSTFATLGTLPSSINLSFGVGFASVSPDGSRLAIGDNTAANSVHIVTLPASPLPPGASTITPTSVIVPSYSAAWSDNATIYVTGFASSSQVARVDLPSTPAFAPSVTTVITNVGSGSGGIKSRSGQLYVGSGFGTGVGDVRAFSLSSLAAASTPMSFTSAPLYTSAFTAATIDFDAAGNIIVTSQSFTPGDINGVAVIAVSTGTRFDLAGLNPDDKFSAVFNPASGEILVRGFQSPTVLRFAIPGPSATGILAIAGLLASRRRRVARAGDI